MNKKTIMMAVLCAVASTASAQLEKGKLLIGGNASYYSTNLEGDFNKLKLRSKAIGPTVGYFVNNNLAIGLKLGYTKEEVKSTSQPQEKSSYSLGTFIRYYLDISTDFKFFGEFMVNAGKGKSEAYQSESDYTFRGKNKQLAASIAPGFAFLPAKRWSVDLRFTLLDYSNYQIKDISPSSLNREYKGGNTFTFGLNTIRPVIGVNYHL